MLTCHSSMDVDFLYAAFCASLEPDLRTVARCLPHRLKLAPAADTPWSSVFNHEVTLAAPALFADAPTKASRTEVRTAVLAHMLAVIEAFGTDRIEDGQVESDSRLRRILAHARRTRDRSLETLIGSEHKQVLDSLAADKRTLSAIRDERRLLESGTETTFEEYSRISLEKQSVGFLGTLALLRSIGGSTETLMVAHSTLAGVWLGLQYFDDVLDWEDDIQHGGAWAATLARLRVELPPTEASDPEALRAAVLSSGVLHEMLEMSASEFRRAERGARQLGAKNLARWARAQEHRMSEAASKERRFPGYTLRAHRLSAWAMELVA